MNISSTDQDHGLCYFFYGRSEGKSRGRWDH